MSKSTDWRGKSVIPVLVCRCVSPWKKEDQWWWIFLFFLPGSWSGGRGRKTKDRNIKPPLNTLFLDIHPLFSNINTTITQSTPLWIARELCRAGEKKKNGKGDEESLGKWDWNERWRPKNEATSDEEMLRRTLKGWEGGYGGSCGCCTPQEPVAL